MGFVANSVGFVAGYPDKTFKPENPVSYNEALTMIVASLGYTAESLPGTWPGAFINKAQGLGIMDICKTTGNAAAPRQDIACFLYDALTSPIGYVDKDGAWQANIGTDGKSGSDTMMARLGAVLFTEAGKTDKDGFFVVDGTESADINMKNYLGAFISAYANKDGDIIAIKEVKSEFLEGDFDDLQDDYTFAASPEYTGEGGFVYFNNGDADDTKSYSDVTGDVKIAVEKSGKKVKTVYSAQIWANGDTFLFDEDMPDEIADKMKLNGHKFADNDDEEIDTSEFALLGVGSLDEIEEDAVVTVYEGTDGTITKIEVSTKTVEGVVTKINKTVTDEASALAAKYTVAGTAYKVNDQITETEADVTELPTMMTNETEATFYLDYAGKIYYFEAEDETSTNYAVVLEMGADNSRYGTVTAYAKMFMADGTAAEFQIKDGFKIGTTEYAFDDFESDGITGISAEEVRGGLAGLISEGALVKYKINTKDQITVIDNITALGGKATIDKNGLVGSDAIKDSTVVFSFAESGDPTDADDYKVLKAADVFDTEATKFAGIADEGTYKAIIVSGVTEEESVVAIFADTEGVNKDGEVWTALYDGEVKSMTVADGYTGDTIAKFTTDSAAAFTLTFDSNNVVTSVKGATLHEATGILLTEKSSVSGNIFKNGTKSFSMASDVVIYVYDVEDEEWSVGSKSSLTGKANAFQYIGLFDTDATADNEYDVVVIFK